MKKEEAVSSLRKQYEVHGPAGGVEGSAVPSPTVPLTPVLSFLPRALLQAAVKRADHLEALLEQQRRQLLAAK